MEIWKEAPSGRFQGIKVSSFGRLRLPPSRLYPEGKIVWGSVDKAGYKIAAFHKKSFKVHRLVASTFIENPHNYPQINHLDGNPTNNKVENLEWCTASQNQAHAIAIGLRTKSSWTPQNIEKAARGSRHGNSKLTEALVLELRALHSKGIPIAELARKYGIGRCGAWQICRRKLWTHI